MSHFGQNKYQKSQTIHHRPTVIKPFQQEIERVPERFCDYMNESNSRFNEICRIYLNCLSIDDIKYLEPTDLINLVPHDQYEHKLLMTIMVRRYLYRNHLDDKDDKNDKDDKTEYSCDKCSHSCSNSSCTHSCDDYTRINSKID